MKVKNKLSGEIVEMTETLYERNKKFFTKVIDESKPKKTVKKVDKKKKNPYNEKKTDELRETD